MKIKQLPVFSFLPAFFALAVIIVVPSLADGALNSSPENSFEFQFRVSEIGNLSHQLDCLSGIAPDNDNGYRKFWTAKLGWTNEDEKQLEIWRELNQKYKGRLKIEQTEDGKLNYPINGASIDSVVLQDRLRFASLLSSSIEDYQRYLEILVLPAEVKKFTGVIKHFYPRFHLWWQAEAEQLLNARAEQYMSLVKEKSLLDLTKRAAVFYGAQFPDDYVIYFHLLYKPMSLSAHSEQVENHALLEVRDKEVISSQLPSLIHELCHHLIRLAPREPQEKLARDFIEGSLPYSLAVYNLLDEALASAIGNGLVVKSLVSDEAFQKYQAREKSFYSDPFIDRAAKALMPIITRRMAEEASIYSGDFAAEYLRAVGDALGELKFSPMLAFKIMAGVFNLPQRPAYWKFLDAVAPGSAFSFNSLDSGEGWDFLERYKELNAAIFLLNSELPNLKRREALLGKANLKQIDKIGRVGKNFVYGIRRSSKSHIYIFVGTNTASLEELVAAFAKSKVGFERSGIQSNVKRN